MKFTIGKEPLINGLQAVQNIVGSRTTLPILSNVLLQGEGKRLELTATDLDVTVSCAVEADIKKGGAFTVPVKKLFGIVRELGASEIEFEVDEKSACKIKSGPSFYKLNGLAAAGPDKGDAAEDLVCGIDGRDAVCAQRHIREPEGSQDNHGGDGRPAPFVER